MKNALDRRKTILELYQAGLDHYGDLYWWPAETPFEVVIGAVLTQNTSWKNVEKAIVNLREASACNAEAIASMHYKKLEKLIRPSGFFRSKRRTLREISLYFKNRDIPVMKKRSTVELRKELLSIKGIGEETADSVLLYALEKNIFVVDAYTKRIFTRHGLVAKNATYQNMQKLVMNSIKRESRVFNIFHSHIVEVGKTYCAKKEPRCGQCPYKKVKGPIS